ncbi:hypothetical protein GTU79_15275 [Sodalis ligni]|uniref:hypothetical protein n=1 Tax=Sodalis ligni TaxID=2697027 RepID=UPI001BDEB1C6|nr:hypothetical protein [Sodalis ligni]QWA08901.1 hypothetical protein GTU79_15275 [Sodalis ligni]
MYVLFAEGGLYLDVDVALKEPLGEIKSQTYDRVSMYDSLMQLEYKYIDEQYLIFYGNAVLAAVKNSASASELLFEAISPYVATDNCLSRGSLNSTDWIVEFSNIIMQYGLRLKQTDPHSRAFGHNVLGKDFNYDDLIWHLKKHNSLFRLDLTKMLTGPNLFYRYFESKEL